MEAMEVCLPAILEKPYQRAKGNDKFI